MVTAKLIEPNNFDHTVSFGSPGKSDGDYTKVGPDFSRASAFTTMDYRRITYGNPPDATVQVDRAHSTVQKWVDDPHSFVLPAGYRLTVADVEWLRRHEQVHFDLMALALRDFLNQVRLEGITETPPLFEQDKRWREINSRMVALNVTVY